MTVPFMATSYGSPVRWQNLGGKVQPGRRIAEQWCAVAVRQVGRPPWEQQAVLPCPIQLHLAHEVGRTVSGVWQTGVGQKGQNGTQRHQQGDQQTRVQAGQVPANGWREDHGGLLHGNLEKLDTVGRNRLPGGIGDGKSLAAVRVVHADGNGVRAGRQCRHVNHSRVGDNAAGFPNRWWGRGRPAAANRLPKPGCRPSRSGGRTPPLVTWEDLGNARRA